MIGLGVTFTNRVRLKLAQHSNKYTLVILSSHLICHKMKTS